MIGKLLAYGVRRLNTGRVTVVEVTETQAPIHTGDLSGIKKVHLHHGIGSFSSEAKAIARAKELADSASVPYVGYDADKYSRKGTP
jgi:hypothetical protein